MDRLRVDPTKTKAKIKYVAKLSLHKDYQQQNSKKKERALEEEGWMAVRRAGRKDGWSDELIGNNTILRPY